jgi:uncharacterized Zn-binding protein involved in type VI secretion
MSYPQARLTDTTSHGGTIITGAMKTMVDGLPAARMGDKHACPIQGHGVTSIITGSLTTMIEGKPAARLGDMTACGATIITASLKAVVN